MTTEAAYTKMVYLWSCEGATSEDVAKRISLNIEGELTPPETTIATGGPFSIAQLPIRHERTVPGRLDLSLGAQKPSRRFSELNDQSEAPAKRLRRR